MNQVERYVFIKLAPEHATPEGRRAVAEETRRVLPTLPGVLSVAVGIPADERSESSWDVSIAVRFASLADVAPYRTHPQHRRYVDAFLAPRLAIIKAWNFEVE